MTKTHDSERPMNGAGKPQPLAELQLGDEGRVVHLDNLEEGLMIRLSSVGLVPGVKLRLRQLRPAAVVSIDSTTLGLDPEIASQIYVTKVGSDESGW